ncbi:cysteine--tRNA ligase [Mycoplasma marinum]|uniref:Cysteine--tRNA ligase n=1 Tax=Mycoplasma marinum TaxID=1937190 RepID=A0A4R0XMV7_9MOLU|nr:cysteine--tRNA ligase [Mycoplasma marinum]TCG11880.1 cysteine--tRNA ligase [Mycoplasma marinum]
MWKWNNKKIAYVSILIAASVVFVIIGSKLFAITTFPSFKVAFGGLPIKITGFLFGPLIGSITGVIADLLSFALMPTYYHPIYTFIMAMSGFVPGVVYLIMAKKERSVNFHFFVTLFVLIICGVGLFIGIQMIPQSTLAAVKSPIKTKWMLQLLACGGIALLGVVHIVLRFINKPKLFKMVAPIILFTVILEIHNSLMTPLADSQSLNLSYGAAYVGHLFTSPIKLLSNVTIISLTYKIVAPLINNKLSNTYDDESGKRERNIYVCGPTVYNTPHIGNLRPIITFDIYIRSLRSRGIKVNFMHNITDIDDKIIKKSIEENVAESEISKRYTKVYLDLLKKANVEKPTNMPLVTKNIKGIVSFIKELENKGVAYEVNGNVYFSVTSQNNYGIVSNRKLDEMRMESSKDKRNPADFALWKKTTEGVLFDSPWGKGRPGWHTECAYFVYKSGGKTLDMHGGGIDLIFPHHENENAQFQALLGKKITNEWKHTGHINVDGTKMSKSLGNVMDADDFFKNYNPSILRLLFLTTSPTAPINLSTQMIDATTKKYEQLLKAYSQAQLNEKIDIKNETISSHVSNWEFSKVMEILNGNLKAFNSGKKEVSKELLANLLLLGLTTKNDKISNVNKKNYKKWINARKNKNYKLADKLRKELQNTRLI